MFNPRPPTGVIRWAASPTRNPGPLRMLRATAAAMVERLLTEQLGLQVGDAGRDPEQLGPAPRRVVGGLLAAVRPPLTGVAPPPVTDRQQHPGGIRVPDVPR